MFDGISSKDMGVVIASPNSGLFEDLFLPNRVIKEVVSAHNEKPYLQKVSHEPLSFPLTIFIPEFKSKSKMRKISRWLFKNYYKPLIFETNPNRIFYAIIEGDSVFKHNGIDDGYVELNVRCDSPYTYTPEYELTNIKFMSSKNRLEIIDNADTFPQGTFHNTELTANGITLSTATLKWSAYLNKKWGEINK